MNIHQLSVTYVVEHDRLLVQVNTLAGEVLSAWLTRRLTANMLPSLQQLATEVELSNNPLSPLDGAGRKMLMEFKKQAALLQSDFQTPFCPQTPLLPFGATPLLVTTVNFTPLGQEGLRVEFQEALPQQPGRRSLQLTLVAELLHGFMHLLENALACSGWGLIENSPPASAEESFIHHLTQPAPLNYLN